MSAYIMGSVYLEMQQIVTNQSITYIKQSLTSMNITCVHMSNTVYVHSIT